MRDMVAALDYVTEIDKAAMSQPTNASDRRRGGMTLDAGDMVTMPVEWLRALLNTARSEGYASLARSEPMCDLIHYWGALTPEAQAELAVERPEAARCLSNLMESL